MVYMTKNKDKKLQFNIHLYFSFVIFYVKNSLEMNMYKQIRYNLNLYY